MVRTDDDQNNIVIACVLCYFVEPIRFSDRIIIRFLLSELFG